MAGKVTILPSTIKNPITTIGEYAGHCYGSDVSNSEKNYKRGLGCIKSGHGRTLEFCDVHLQLDGWSIRTMREFMRHVSDGLTALQSSTRYINESNFDYFTPIQISKDEDNKSVYDSCMEEIRKSYEYLLSNGVKKEDAANLLPLGLIGTVVIKKNARALQTMSEVRLCARAYHEYRDLMRKIVQELKNYSEEWAVLADLIFKPKCEVYGYCEEEYSCGRYPKKNLTK